MKKQLKIRLYPFIPLLISIFMIAASVALFYYVKGYRFNFETQEISSTGILTIDSVPSNSSLYIDDKLYGKTPKNISLDEGKYDIKIKKDGYYTWEKTVSIKEGSSTPIYPWLISKKADESEFYSSSEIFDNTHLYKNDISVFFTLYTDDNNTRRYEIYKLSTNLNTFDFSNNPQKVLSFNLALNSEQTFSILVSPDSSKILFTINDGDSKDIYIIETDKENILDNLEPIDIGSLSSYAISWNKSNDSLLFESDEDIISYDIDSGIRYLITKKEDSYLYTFSTDSSGLIYLMKGTSDESQYSYTLYQYKEDGTLQKKLISSIYFFVSGEYIEMYRNTDEDISLPFKNSKESTKTSGKILSFEIYEDADGIFIQTEYAGYWYNLNTSRFMIVSPYSTSSVAVSPLENIILFKNDKEVGTLVIEIQEGDPNSYVGERSVWSKDPSAVSNVQWIENGKAVIFEENSVMYTSDEDGDNICEIYNNNTPLFFSPENDPSAVFTAYVSDDDIFFIYELSIH